MHWHGYATTLASALPSSTPSIPLHALGPWTVHLLANARGPRRVQDRKIALLCCSRVALLVLNESFVICCRASPGASVGGGAGTGALGRAGGRDA